MAAPDLSSLLATFSTAAASHTELQDSVEIVVQLVEALIAQELHYPTLQSLAPSLPSSLTSLLLVLPSSLLPLLGALFAHTSTERLPFLHSRDNAKDRGRFRKGAERAGEAVERAVKGVLRGLKGYVDDSDREEKISKEVLIFTDRDLVGEHCFGPLVALLSPNKLRMALKRKVLDIIDYSISHHPSNKTRLLSPALFGAQGLGRILADSEDYGLTERALELGWRLRDGVGGKEKKEKWDQQLWMAMGEGEQEEAIRRRWKGVKKVTYLDDAADILALLGARDVTRYQNVHALTLTANSHTFIENASAPRSASYDQSVSFDRVSFTATTTREIGEDDALQQDLELELESVERVLIEQAGDVLSIRIVSFHPPTLDSAPLPLSLKSKDKEHHISFTMRAKDGPKLADVLDARKLLWESSVDLTALAEHGASLPTPKKTPSVAPARKKKDINTDTTSNPSAAPAKSKSKSKAIEAPVGKETGSKPEPTKSEKSKEPKVKASTKPLPEIPPPSQQPSKLFKPVTVPLGVAPPPERPSAPLPGKTRFSRVDIPLLKDIAAAKRKPKEQGGAKEDAAPVVVGGLEARAQKRKAGDEVEAGGLGAVERAKTGDESRKKQRVGEEVEELEQGGRKSKSVAFQQRSPTTKRLSTTTSLLSPSRNFGARSPHRSPTKPSPYRQLFSRADDSGYGAAGEDAQLGQKKLDIDCDGGSGGAELEEEEEDEEIGEMLSQMMEGRPKKEVEKILERLQKYGGEEEEEMEELRGENDPDFEEHPLPTVNSPSRNGILLNASPKVIHSSPRVGIDNNEQPQPLQSPFGSLRKRIAFGHGEGVQSKVKKSKPAGKKEKGSVGGEARARRKDSKKKDGKGRDQRKAEDQQGMQRAEDLVTAERDQKAHDEIGRTLMALSAIVLDNFQQGRIKANGKFGASKRRIGDKAYSLSMQLHQSTTAVSSATRDEVFKLKGVTGRMQQLAARSRAFGEGLMKEMNA